ncbi:galactonate dehydratase (plasmid) [Haloferax prahovense]|uniref:galactonate dehydratase n=1 Tax=Haloferax prahovense TaxID=381852 RepID=UPI003C722806
MVLTDYELFAVPPRWLFLKLETSDGRVGWGEPRVEGGAKSVQTAVQELLEGYLLGEDPAQIQDHWQMMYRGGFHRGGSVLMSAIAGIDQALWDLKGKEFGAPVYQLLGGAARDRIRVYQWIGGEEPEEMAEEAAALVDRGLTAMKMNATGKLELIDSPAAIDAAVARMRAVREAVGDEVEIAVDFHGRASKPMAKRLAAALDPYDPYFIEEPVRPEHNDILPAIAAKTNAPIATGERLFSRWDFKQILQDGAVDVVQPDISHAGGITECYKIASMAEAYDVAFAPHCPLGPVALAASLHVDAVAPNTLIQEQSLGIHYDEAGDVLDYLIDNTRSYGPLIPYDEEGFVELPTKPGLGVELDEEVLRERSSDPGWQTPTWRHADGSVAEW